MALTVETGVGVAGADSYASLAAADAFHASRGNSAWAAANTTNKEIALRRASDYIDTHMINGAYLVFDQGLAWPFEDTDDVDADLRQLSRATIMLAPIALTNDILVREPDSAQVLSSTDKVGEISESRTYANNSGEVVLLYGFNIAFLSPLLSRFVTTGGMVVGRRYRG